MLLPAGPSAVELGSGVFDPIVGDPPDSSGGLPDCESDMGVAASLLIDDPLSGESETRLGGADVFSISSNEGGMLPISAGVNPTTGLPFHVVRG